MGLAANHNRYLLGVEHPVVEVGEERLAENAPYIGQAWQPIA